MRSTRLGTCALAAAAVVLAGVVLPAATATAQAPAVTRYAGVDRFDTAAKVAAGTFTAPVPVAFIARGDAFADALAGTPAAAVDGGPVLLVENGSIPPATAAELTALKPGKIVVLGGPSAVADSVVSGLHAYTAGSVTRLAGADRYATAAAVSAATFSPGVGAAYIATDLGFADALAGGAAAGTANDPILIVQQAAIPAATAQELTRLHPASVVILGGSAAVSDAVATQLGSYTTGAVTRVAGADRYATAVAISQSSFPGTAAAVYLATGANFPDALAGGAAAALAPGPLLLVLATCIPASVSAEITRLNPSKVFILGGDGAVGPGVDSLTACAPTMTITPDTGLVNGEVVHIVGTGFVPGKQYVVLECANKGASTTAGDCDPPGANATADANGTVTLDFPVAQGPFGTNNVVCGASQPCLVTIGGLAALAIGFGSAPGAQMMTITPNTGLTDGQVVHIVATGYVPGVQYVSIECADKGLATAPGDCASEIKLATADATGTVTLDYAVMKGPFGPNNIVCSPTQPCMLGVAGKAPDGSSQAATEDLNFS